MGSVCLSLIVAQVAGRTGLGQLAVFLSITSLLAIVACRGSAVIIVRVIAATSLAGRTHCYEPVLRKAVLNVAGWGLLLSTTVVGGGGIVTGEQPFSTALMAAVVLAVPILAVLMVFAGFLNGAGYTWIAPFFQIGGVSLIAAVLLIPMRLSNHVLEVEAVIYAIVIALLFLGCSAFVLLRSLLPKKNQPSQRSLTMKVDSNVDTSGQYYLLFIALSIFLSQAGAFILVAPFLSESELGLARAAERLTQIVGFPLLVIAPFIARSVMDHLTNRSILNTWKVVIKASMVGLLISLVPAIFLGLHGEKAMSWFGVSFTDAVIFLPQLIAAQLLIVVMGPFVVVLNMGGADKPLFYISITILLSTFICYPLAAKFAGLQGFLFLYSILPVLRVVLISVVATKLINNLQLQE